MAAERDLKYTPEHEWLLVEGDVATVGITSYAAERLGNVGFVELPDNLLSFDEYAALTGE